MSFRPTAWDYDTIPTAGEIGQRSCSFFSHGELVTVIALLNQDIRHLGVDNAQRESRDVTLKRELDPQEIRIMHPLMIQLAWVPPPLLVSPSWSELLVVMATTIIGLTASKTWGVLSHVYVGNVHNTMGEIWYML